LGGPPYALQWHRSTFGIGIGVAGLAIEDLDGDGEAEIVASTSAAGYGSATFWYILSYRNGSYVHVWTSTPYPQDIGSLRVVNVDADPVPEIVVGAGGTLYVYDGATRALQATVTTTAAQVRGLAVADVDSDGALEFVFCDAATLYVYGVASGALEYAGPGLGGQDLALGNVDNDPALEIVVADGPDPGYVVDGQTHAVEWTNYWGFGQALALGDIDNDGRDEVVSGYSYVSHLNIFDVELQSLAATLPVEHGADALRIFDVEGDGPLEIVYGDELWYGIYVYNGQTLLQKWSVPNPDFGVTRIAFGDPDGDGTMEMVWGAGYSSTGPDHLHVLDTVTHGEEWQSRDFGGPFRALSYGDVDADGRAEIVSGSFDSDSGYAGGLYFIHDALTQELEFQSGQLTTFSVEGLWRIRNANVDGDPQQEIFVTTGYGYDGLIICYDGLTHAEQWRTAEASDQTFAAMALADVDGDGQLEVVAGVPGYGYLYVFNAATGALEWQSPNVGAGTLLRIADVDGDNHLEIVVVDFTGRVHVVDGVTHAVTDLGDHDATALETPDRDGNGVAEIVIGTQGGALQVLDPLTGTVVQTIGTYGGRIDGLAVADVTGTAAADYAFAINNEVFVYDGGTNALVWSSGVIGDSVGAQDSLLIADVDADGVLELLVSLGLTGFRVYEGGPLRLFAGDASAPEAPGGAVAVFTVALSSAAASPVTVQYSTADGTATAGSDYLSTSGTLVFLPNTTTRTVSVTVLDDTVYEGNETFFLNLSNPTGATIQDGQGVATILENEPQIFVSIDDAAVVEGDAGNAGATFTVTLSAPSTLTTTVSYATADGTATAPGDYLPSSGTVTFPPSVVSQPVTVPVVGDAVVEADELFFVNLSGPVNGAIGDGQGTGTIIDDDAPSLSRIELGHGSVLVADLAAQPGPVADQDFYRIGQEPRSSYEVVVDAASGDVVPLGLDRLAADNATVMQSGSAVGTGTSVSLRWMNTSSFAVVNQHLRLRSGGCGTDCAADDTYRVRAFETTYSVPRFNNSGTQLTVLLVQNPTGYPVSGVLYFWSPSGALLHAQPLALGPKQLFTVNTSTVPALVGQSGSVTLANDARYGDLTGKAVALEPGTGFSFDSILTLAPR
jgi:hypothetical protein